MFNLAKFRDAIANCRPSQFHKEAGPNSKLFIPEKSDNSVRAYSAPFDYVNTTAKLGLVGITPGREQLNKALFSCCTQLHLGRSDSELLQVAKHAASFGGAGCTRPLSNDRDRSQSYGQD